MQLWIVAIMALALAGPAQASGGKSKKDPTAVMAYVKQETQASCLKPVRAVGSQWATESGAEESAQKSWREEVRFHHGESAADLDKAKEYARRCTKSSIGEVVGQSLYRCEVEAVPCRPGFTRDK